VVTIGLGWNGLLEAGFFYRIDLGGWVGFCGRSAEKDATVDSRWCHRSWHSMETRDWAVWVKYCGVRLVESLMGIAVGMWVTKLKLLLQVIQLFCIAGLQQLRADASCLLQLHGVMIC